MVQKEEWSKVEYSFIYAQRKGRRYLHKNHNRRQPAGLAVYNPYIIHGRSYPALCSGPLVFHVRTAIRAGYQHHDKCFPKTTGRRSDRENER